MHDFIDILSQSAPLITSGKVEFLPSAQITGGKVQIFGRDYWGGRRYFLFPVLNGPAFLAWIQAFNA